MNRRNETIWWCCVCLLVSALTGLAVYRTTSTDALTASVDASTPNERPNTSQPSFEEASKIENPLVREAKRLVAASNSDATELRRILDGYADGTFSDEAGVDTPVHIIRHYARTDSEGALAYLLGHEHWANQSSLIFLEWAEVDPEAAIAALDQLGPLPRMSAESAILHAHRFLPLDDFIALQNRLTSPQNNAAFSSWALEKVRNDPQNGWTDVVRIDREYPAREYAWTYASEWSLIDASSALDAFEELDQSEDEKYGAVFGELVQFIAMNDPRSALLWLEKQPPNSPRQALKPSLLTRLADHDPLEALDRAAYLSVEMRARAEQMILRQWSHYEPEQAAEWLMSFGDVASLQDVLPLLALAQHDSSQARRIASLITNHDKRNEILDQLDG